MQNAGIANPFAASHRAASQRAASRIDWVDYAKGICIIFVVMMHSTLGVEKAVGAEGWMHYAVQFAKPFRMPDFFLISGLFLGLVIDRPWLRYLDRKVLHFAYFYVLWTAIQFAFKAPAWIAEGQSASEVGILYLQSFVQPFGTQWFIYLLPVFFVVTRLLKAVPWQITLGMAALLEILPVHTGSLVIDEFAARYVYFFAGYWFAANIFAIANWAQASKTKVLLFVAGWFLINGIATFTPVPPALLSMPGAPQDMQMLSDLPLVSLMFGTLGAAAIVLVSALVSNLHSARFLRYLGRNSIVVYLAFFLPMAVTRGILLKFAPQLDPGTVSLFVTAAGVIGPVILFEIVRRTGYGRFLFERPNWAKLERAAKPRQTLHPSPAE